MSPRAFSFFVALLAGATLCSAARSQCATTWSSAAPQPELGGTANCSTVWDPDGAGPAPLRLVVGGENLIGGAAPAGQRVMTFDGAVWQSLADGPGTTGQVTAVTTWNGLLVAAGTFTGAGMNRIALWDGSAWQPLGPGLANNPAAITEWNGNLVAGANVTGGPVISVWNGATWATLPQPPSLVSIRTMTPFGGELFVGGSGSSPLGALERWNGTSWGTTIPANGRINCLGVRSFQFISSLYAAGDFTTIGAGGTPVSRVASTSGGTSPTWSNVGNSISAVLAMHVRATSALGVAVVVRTSAAPGAGVGGMFQLSGSTFAPMGTSQVGTIAFYGGSYHGTAISIPAAAACLRYDGTNWTSVIGQGITGEVRALARSGADMIVGGTIQSATGPALNRVARWNGTTFQSLGTGIAGISVDALTTLDNGDVVAGGVFTAAGGLGANNIARWTGSAWAPFGTGTDQQVLAVAKMANGDVIAGGKFTLAGGVACARVARWNGTAWSPLGLGMNGDVNALAVRSDGTVFAGGAFTVAGGIACSRIARWNGTSWLPVGTGCNGDVHALTVRPNDDVVAAGAFLTAGGVAVDRCARWNGSAWSTMAASSGDATIARAVVALPNGDVVAGRGFHQPSTSPDAGIARWNGSTWSGFDPGLAMTDPALSVAVRALAQRADGALIVGGTFGIAGGFVARGLAMLSPTCPALATSYGAGCNSLAGPLVLGAETLPWIGATFRTATTGVAPASVCLGVTGFSPVSIALPTILPEGQPGCSLLASPDILTLVLPDATGTARTALALANSPALLGAAFFQQTVPLEFNPAGAIVAIRGSNALALSIGTL